MFFSLVCNETFNKRVNKALEQMNMLGAILGIILLGNGKKSFVSLWFKISQNAISVNKIHLCQILKQKNLCTGLLPQFQKIGAESAFENNNQSTSKHNNVLYLM